MNRAPTDDDDQRVYILGIGNLGKLFAHSLAQNKLPVTLLLHRKGLLKEWKEAGRNIQIMRDGIWNKQFQLDVELIATAADDDIGIESRGDPIKNVIVTTKAPRTAAALAQIKHRLDQGSSILFTQNGMGAQASKSHASRACSRCRADS